jgi:hypothetical protein
MRRRLFRLPASSFYHIYFGFDAVLSPARNNATSQELDPPIRWENLRLY